MSDIEEDELRLEAVEGIATESSVFLRFLLSLLFLVEGHIILIFFWTVYVFVVVVSNHVTKFISLPFFPFSSNLDVFFSAISNQILTLSLQKVDD